MIGCSIRSDTSFAIALTPEVGQVMQSRNPGSRFIVKIRRIASNMVLVHDKNRAVEFECETTKDLDVLFGNRLKLFRWATVRNGKLIVGDGAGSQRW